MAPDTAPNTPIVAPDRKKIRLIAARLTPMVLRIPMSDDLELTSVTKPEMMFKPEIKINTDRMINKALS